MVGGLPLASLVNQEAGITTTWSAVIIHGMRRPKYRDHCTAVALGGPEDQARAVSEVVQMPRP